METEKGMMYMDDTVDKLRCYAERKHEAGYTELANGILKAVNYINNNIGRVDAVQVVRCKDCKMKYEYTPTRWFCGISGLPIDDADFCSYGERRTDGR